MHHLKWILSVDKAKQTLEWMICLSTLSSVPVAPKPQATEYQYQAAQQKMSGWLLGEASSVEVIHHPPGIPAPVQLTAVVLDSPCRGMKPTVSCTLEDSRLQAMRENSMPKDPRWSSGSDTSTGECGYWYHKCIKIKILMLSSTYRNTVFHNNGRCYPKG